MRHLPWIIPCCAIFAIASLSGCAKPKPPTLAQDGGYVLTYRIAVENPDISPEELENRVVARLQGYGNLRGVEAKFADNELHVTLPGVSEEQLNFCQNIMLAPAQLSLQIVADPKLDSIFFDKSADSDPLKITSPAGQEAIWTPVLFPKDVAPDLPTREVNGVVHVLLLIQAGDVSGTDFSKFRRTSDSQAGGLALEFEMNPAGAKRIRRLTELNRDRKMAMVFQRRIVTMPSIQGTIADRGIVTGKFSEDSLADLLRIGELAKYGELPSLILLSTEKVAPN